MKIEEVYKLIILKDVIDSLLKNGTSLTADNIESELQDRIDGDLSKPQFTKDIAKVVYNTEALASDWRDILKKADMDLQVLFSAMGDLISTESMMAERWDAELKSLEKEVDDLTNRVQELLHHLSDTTGYFSYVGDDFSNDKSFQRLDTAYPLPYSGLADQSNFVPARIDIGTHTVSLPPATDGSQTTTKIDLHEVPEQDIKFTVQTVKDLVSSSLASHSQYSYIFSPREQVWKYIVKMAKPGKVTGVLQAKLDSDNISVSKIEIELHTVTPEDVMTITPQYSTDGKNWYFIPNVNIMKTGYDVIIFSFPTVEFQYLRLIIEKDNYDYEERGLFIYEFGIEELRLFNNTYDTTKGAYYVSAPLKPKLGSNLLQKADAHIPTSFKFTRASLEVCEDIPEGTEINYYVSVDNGNTWQGIDPINRINNRSKPTVIDFVERGTYTASNIGIAYDTTKALDAQEIFPGRVFDYLNWDGDQYSAVSITFADRPYIPSNAHHSILNLIIKDDAEVVYDTIKIWRNVGEKGNTDEVRDFRRGWRVEGSYYLTVVKVSNTDGLSIDLGNREASIDGGAPVRGKVTIPYGTHTFKTHKDNWKDVASGATSLVDLIEKDPLYPYNHKLLIEGYSYDSNYTDEKVYKGVDRFAGYLMKPIDLKLFKALDNEDYSRYAIVKNMTDGTNKFDGIVVKFDSTQDNFVNEKFVIEFPSAKNKWDTIAFLAMLRTRNSSVSPTFSKYVLRLSL